MTKRLPGTIAVPLLVVVAFVVITAAQSDSRQSAARDSGSTRMTLVELATAARSNTPEDVGRLTDGIVDNSLAATASSSLRSRLYQTELQFRQGAISTIEPDLLTDVINDEVAVRGLSRHLRVAPGQLQLVRQDLRPMLRHLSPSDAPGAEDSLAPLSPAEAVFIGLDLALQKAINAEFQVAPETWEEQSRARRSAVPLTGPGTPPSVKASVSLRAGSLSIQFPDLSDDNSELVKEIHGVLDKLGFAR